MRQNIYKIKRHVDILAHYQALHYALLLPETNKQSARGFAGRLAEILTQLPSQETLKGPININIGFASVPEDCQELEELLALAQPKSH